MMVQYPMVAVTVRERARVRTPVTRVPINAVLSDSMQVGELDVIMPILMNNYVFI